MRSRKELSRGIKKAVGMDKKEVKALPGGKYKYVSRAAETIFGYTPQEFYKYPLLIKEAMHPNWRDFFAQQWKLLLAGKISPIYEYQIIHKSGEVRWLNQRNVLVKNESEAFRHGYHSKNGNAQYATPALMSYVVSRKEKSHAYTGRAG